VDVVFEGLNASLGTECIKVRVEIVRILWAVFCRVVFEHPVPGYEDNVDCLSVSV
jgi:hypothetical protein